MDDGAVVWYRFCSGYAMLVGLDGLKTGLCFCMERVGLNKQISISG